MSELNQFGAVLTYAIGLEGKIAAYYEKLGDADRAKSSQKRQSKLERVRRENVVEITLEPIDGLDEADYVFDFEDASAAGQAAIEATATQFYDDAAPKINVRQAQRALEKVAKQHRQLAES